MLRNLLAVCILGIGAFVAFNPTPVEAQFDACPPLCWEDLVPSTSGTDSHLAVGGLVTDNDQKDTLRIINERDYNIYIAVLAMGDYPSEWSEDLRTGWYMRGWYKVEAYDSQDISLWNLESNNVYIHAIKWVNGDRRSAMNRFDRDGDLRRDDSGDLLFVEATVTHSSGFAGNTQEQIDQCDWEMRIDSEEDCNVVDAWFRKISTRFLQQTEGVKTFTFNR